MVSTLLSVIGQVSGIISLSVPAWLAWVSDDRMVHDMTDGIQSAWATPVKGDTENTCSSENLADAFLLTQLPSRSRSSTNLSVFPSSVHLKTCHPGHVSLKVEHNCKNHRRDGKSATSEKADCLYRLALFGWNDLNTARYVGIMIAIAIAWRLVAWMSIAARVGGFR